MDDAHHDYENPGDDFFYWQWLLWYQLENVGILSKLEYKVAHFEPSHQKELIALLREYEYLFGDEAGRTDMTCYDVDAGQAMPIKQQPYRLSPYKLKLLRKTKLGTC